MYNHCCSGSTVSSLSINSPHNDASRIVWMCSLGEQRNIMLKMLMMHTMYVATYVAMCKPVSIATTWNCMCSHSDTVKESYLVHTTQDNSAPAEYGEHLIPVQVVSGGVHTGHCGVQGRWEFGSPILCTMKRSCIPAVIMRNCGWWCRHWYTDILHFLPRLPAIVPW